MQREDDASDEDGEYDDGGTEEDGGTTTFLELHNAVAGGTGGVQLTELDGDQMQVGRHTHMHTI